MSFYDGRCLDPRGGFFHFFKDDGTVYDRQTRHLVSSTRFVFNHAMAARRFGQARWRDAARHGLRFLQRGAPRPGERRLRLAAALGRRQREVLDATNHCYGLAFVLLAHAHALRWPASARRAAGIGQTFELMEQRFWEPEHGLYADEATADWQLAPYRGQNANMHACEAMLAAFEATREHRYLRSRRDARRVDHAAPGRARRRPGLGALPQPTGTPDWDYNRHDKSNIFRPWGYQPGHLTEWAKLLLILERDRPGRPGCCRARASCSPPPRSTAGTTTHGGLLYGFAADERHPGSSSSATATSTSGCRPRASPRRRCWPRAPAKAATGTGTTGCGTTAGEHFVDHQHGAWYRILTPDNRKLTDEKSPAGKTDYHTMGACYEVLNVVS